MKPVVVMLVAVALGAAASAAAAPRLRPIMQDWKAQANRAQSMLSGAIPYDQVAFREILTTMTGDARDVEAGIKGASAQAVDAKDRFSKFEADASATLQASATRDAAGKRFQQVVADCRSCHDALRN